MAGIDEDATVWRYLVRDPKDFDRFHVKELGKGIKIINGRIKGTNRWEIQNYTFDKQRFKTREEVRSWVDGHLKGAIHSLLDFKAYDEYKRMAYNAYLQISSVQG